MTKHQKRGHFEDVFTCSDAFVLVGLEGLGLSSCDHTNTMSSVERWLNGVTWLTGRLEFINLKRT